MNTVTVSKAEFRVSLEAVRNRVGISREDERRLRPALAEGRDWAGVANGVRYSEAGVAGLLGLVAGEKKGAGTRQVEAGGALDGGLDVGAQKKAARPGAFGEEGEGGPHPGPLPEGEGEAAARREALAGQARPPESTMAVIAFRASEEAFLVRTLRCHFRNGRVVEVKVSVVDGRGEERAGVGERGFMAVRSSENFLPGMLCWARKEAGQGNWTFLGRGDRPAGEVDPVCPRARGRW